MAVPLRFEVCAYFAPEVRAALHAEKINDVTLSTFCGGCDDRNGVPPSSAEAQSSSTVMRIGGHCMGRIKPYPQARRIDSCFDWLLGPSVVARLLAEGVHLLTPTMLLGWREHSAALGLAAADAVRFYAESCTRMVLVDCGLAPVAMDTLAAYAEFTGVPIDIMPANLDYLRLYLQHVIAVQRLLPKGDDRGDR